MDGKLFAELKEDIPGDFASNEGKLAWYEREELMGLEMPYTAKFVMEHYLQSAHRKHLLTVTPFYRRPGRS